MGCWISEVLLIKGCKLSKKRTAPGEPPPADEFPGLKESVDAILRELNQGYLTVPKGVPKTTATQTFGYAARQLIANFEVHVDQHAPGFLECWMRNHLRAIIHPLDRDRQIVRKSVDFVRSANTDAILPASLTARLNEDQIERLNALKVRYQEKKGTLLTDPDLKKDRAKLLTFLLTLRREIESLNSLAEKKYFTLLPEASITNAHIRLDTRCMAYIAKKLEALTGSSADKLAKDRDLVWKSLFDLEKMKQLKKKWKFSETITTDGVGVSILFERNIPTPPNMKIPKTDPVFLNAFDRGLLWESQVKFEPEATSSQHYRFIAIDPGIKNPVASVDMLDGSRYRLSQAHYNSLFRSHKICRKKLEHKYHRRCLRTFSSDECILNEISQKAIRFFRPQKHTTTRVKIIRSEKSRGERTGKEWHHHHYIVCLYYWLQSSSW